MMEMGHFERVPLFKRMRRFWAKPIREKRQVLQDHWNAFVATVPRMIRLPNDSLWLLRRDYLGGRLLEGSFEIAEISFVQRFLGPGMTVLDLGAHHGLYTLLASKRVGPNGKVFAFEPSPRERRALRLHVAINGCRNVRIESTAIGCKNGHADLFVTSARQTGCNSLRPPAVLGKTTPVRVEVIRLDDWLNAQKIAQVDFIKLDVEGAELSALEGGATLFRRRPRPVVLAEVQDVRTRPWGYAARDILQFLLSFGYTWFQLSENGTVEPLNLSPAQFDGNFIACPAERLGELGDPSNFKRSG